MRAIHRPLEGGARMDLAELQDATVTTDKGAAAQGRAPMLHGVESGEKREHIVLAKDLADGEDVSVHDDATVLGISREQRGNARLWIAMPVSAYAEGGD